jgi:hypothetical protein
VARTDNDSWEITESVGATALGVAAARAADTESDDPLISDPFARVFLDRVGSGVWNWYGAPELPAEVVEAEPDMPQRMQTSNPRRCTNTAPSRRATGSASQWIYVKTGQRRCGGPGLTRRRRARGQSRGC